MIILTLFIAMLLELFATRFGIVLPVIACTAFYYSVVFSWKKSVLSALLMLAVLDLALARPYPCSLLTMLPLQLGATLWRYQGNTRSIFPQTVPGFLLGMLTSGILWLHARCAGAGLSMELVMRTCLGSALLLPLLVPLLDRLARQFGRRQYATISRYTLSFRHGFSFDSMYE